MEQSKISTGQSAKTEPQQRKEQSSNGQWDEQQKIEVGSLAAQALKNPVFNVVFQQLEYRNWVAWQSEPPDHTKSILHLHTRQQLLKEIFQEMARMAAEAEELIRQQQLSQSAAAKENELLNNQGFN